MVTAIQISRYRMFVFLGLVVGCSAASNLNAEESVGRYSLLRNIPTTAQRDLLGSPVTVNLPDTVHTVGEAIAVVLQSTGYRLASPVNSDPARAPLLALALPGVHRELGTLTVRRALNVLVGPAFQLVEDPVHRLVSFERCRPVGSTAVATPGPR